MFTTKKLLVILLIGTTIGGAFAIAQNNSTASGAASANPVVARKLAAEEMTHWCQVSQQPDGSLQNIWISGEAVMATWVCGSFVGEIAFTMSADGSPGNTEVFHLGPKDKLRHIALKELADKDMKPADARQLIALRDQK